MKYNNLKGSLILGAAALIWGLAFVAQTGAADLVPPFAVNALRSFIAAIALYFLHLILNRKAKEPFFPKENKLRKKYFSAAAVCGLFFFVAVNFQQFGISFYPKGVETEARSGFITALYVILVPLFSAFMGKKISPYVLGAVAVAVVGVYMLCFSKGFIGIYLADLLVFICAVCFALHIMAIDEFVGITGGIKLSIMQFLVCGVISGILSLIFEARDITLANLYSALGQILYLGLMSSAVAYTLQITGQKYAEPSVASISMSFESVFAALGGWIIMGNGLSPTQIAGCVIMFASIVLAQIPEFSKKK